MSVQILSPTTAGIAPEKFTDGLFFSKRRLLPVILGIMLLSGFVLRVNDLGVESLSEDELNKLQTVQEYRTNGLSGKNGEHPFLMKGLQTVSILSAEKLNSVFAISEEAALRFPIALFGTFTILLIFLLVSELFGRSIAIVSAALWAVEPMAIGFDRIAKEDSLVLFFFLLTSLFFVKSQTKAEHGNRNWIRYVWAAAASYGALMTSKYYPFFLSIIGGYYNVFLQLPGNKWNVGNLRWLKFFVVMGVTFLILNPTIVLPDTWHEMLKFSSENRIGHDSYEYMGQLYSHKVTNWLAGVPWTFYYVFIAVKTSLVTLLFFFIGLPVMFKRKLGDGRFYILLWAFLWFMPFTVLGGKFTRYFTFAEPLILIVAATGFCFLLKMLSEKLSLSSSTAVVFQTIFLAAFLAFPLFNSLSAAPHFRLFTNQLGGGMSAAGTYFPHDEFYDTSTSEIIVAIEPLAAPQTIVACETPLLFEHYEIRSGKKNLSFVSLSDKNQVAALKPGDFIVITRGRRYFSNTAYEEYLKTHANPSAEIAVAGVTSALIYKLDEPSLMGIQTISIQ
ncbi:MAG: glycosyltransferase family 39 protein [Pyrinomonadaceae bacterium]